MSDARAILEAEDPKSVFRAAVTVPPPPDELLRDAIASKERYLGKLCERTSTFTNPLGETFVFGEFGRGAEAVMSTLFYFDRAKREWQLIDPGTFTDLAVEEAEDPKGVFKKVTTTPHYKLEPVWMDNDQTTGAYDVWIGDEWYARMRKMPGGWEMMWLPEIEKHPAPEMFKTPQEAALWVWQHRLMLRTGVQEAEDPKSVFRKFSRDIESFLKRMNFEKSRESFYQQIHAGKPMYQTWIKAADEGWWRVRLSFYYIHAAEGSLDYTIAWDLRLHSWANDEELNCFFGAGWDSLAQELHRQIQPDPAQEAQEDPKSFIKTLGKTCDSIAQLAGFEPISVVNATRRWRKRCAGLGADWWLTVERAADGTDYWELEMVGQDGERRGGGYEGYGPLDLERKLRYLCVLEGEDPKSVLRAISGAAAPNPHNGKLVSGQLLRRLASGYPVNGVYIWYNSGGFPNNEGILQISFRNYGLIRQEWASFGVLAGALLRWRNLEGAKLWVNGKAVDPVGRDNKLLQAIDRDSWRTPEVHVGGGPVAPMAEARKPKKPAQPEKPVTEDPKAFFQRMISTGKAAALGKSAAYAELLQYAPDDFVRAFQRKQEADWEMDDFMFTDQWPSYDDDLADEEEDEDGDPPNPWREYSYYFNYHTEGGKIYIVPMSVDSDGDHDSCGEWAEVGTPDADRILKEYGAEGHDKAMLEYWQWVVDEGGYDPLNYVNNPNPPRQLKKTFIAGFVRDGDRLKLWGIRNVSNPPSPPVVPWPEVWQKAQEDADFKQMMDWLMVDQNGYTEATEEQVVEEGGKWDQQNRLIVKWSWEVKEEVAIQRQHVVQVAQRAIREIQRRQR